MRRGSCGETVVTIVGYLVGDPSCGAPLRESRSRIPLRRTSRGFLDRASGTWKDGDAVFLRARLWRHRAENAAETLHDEGNASHIFCGRLRKRTSGIAAGAQRTEVEVEEIGLSQRYATAAVSYVARATRSSTPAGSIGSSRVRACSRRSSGSGNWVRQRRAGRGPADRVRRRRCPPARTPARPPGSPGTPSDPPAPPNGVASATDAARSPAVSRLRVRVAITGLRS